MKGSTETPQDIGPKRSGWGDSKSQIINPFAKNTAKESGKFEIKQVPFIGGENNEKLPLSKFSQRTPVKFHFGTGKIFDAIKPANTRFVMSFNLSAPKPVEKVDDNEDQTVDVIESTAIVSSVTGEENEEVIISSKAAFYVLVKKDDKQELAEKGVGELHLNKGDNYFRFIMRRDNALKTICLNCRIFQGMNPKLRNAKQIQLLVNLPDQSTPNVAVLRFPDENTAKSLLEKLSSIITDMGKTE